MDSVGKALLFVLMIVAACVVFVLVSVGALVAIRDLFNPQLQITPSKVLAVMFLLVLMGSSGWGRR